MKKILGAILKFIAEKAKKVGSNIFTPAIERERRKEEREERRDTLRREQIKQWRKMIFDLKQKNNKEQDITIGTKLKEMLGGHEEYLSLYPHLSEETKEKIEYNEDSYLYYVKDDMFKLMARDIDDLEKRWDLTI